MDFSHPSDDQISTYACFENTYMKENFTVLCKSGKGSFGTVYKVIHNKEKEVYALKVIPIREEDKDCFLSEIEVLTRIGYHRNIVGYITSWSIKCPVSYGDNRYCPIKENESSNSSDQDIVFQKSSCSASSIRDQQSSKSKVKSSGNAETSRFFSSSPFGTQSSNNDQKSSGNIELSSCSSSSVFVNRSANSNHEIYVNSETSSYSSSPTNDQQSSSNEIFGNVETSSFSSSFMLGPRSANSDNESSGNIKTSTNSSSSVSKKSSSSASNKSSSSEHESQSSSGSEIFGRDSNDSGNNESTSSGSKRTWLGKTLIIQFEYCEQTLKQFIDKHIPCKPGEEIRILLEIIDGMNHFHNMKIIHRDLSLRNILLDSNGHVKIGDFGMAKMTETSNIVTTDNTDKNGDGSLTMGCGTYLYQAPEVQCVGNKQYDHGVDIYSLGIIMFEICYRFSTYAERAKVLVELRKSLTFPSDFDEKVGRGAWQYKAIISGLLHINSSERLSLQQMHCMLRELYICIILRFSNQICRRWK